MDENRFVGRWKLVSWVKKTPDGNTSYPFGENAVGYIIYTEDGFVTATLMAANRSPIRVSPYKLALKPRYAMALIRYLKAAGTFVNYSGSFRIVGDTVIHHVETSLYPDWVGTDLVRTFIFAGDQLTLLAEETPGVIHELVWANVRHG